MDAINAIVDNIVLTRFADIPASAIEASRKSILDAFATTIAGSSAPGIQNVLQVLEGWGGRAEASVVIFGQRLPAYHAVFGNMVMCHALEIDDAHYPSITHPTAATLWPALAAAEQAGGVSGRDLLCAIVLGIDTLARIGQAARKTLDNGYNPAVYAGFGAAVAAGKLRGLDADTLRHALGITFSQAAATMQAAEDGALVKRLQPAFNASAGMRAVEFARAGITGIQNIIECQFGIGRLFNHGPIDRNALLDGLGQHFLAAELAFKRFPTSRCAHAPIEGTLALVKQHNIAPEDVEEVTVAVQESCYRRESKPFDPKVGTPQVKAQFSIDYCVAAAILWRDVFIRELQDERVLDPAILDVTRKIRVVRNTDIGATQYLPVRVAIRTTRGAVFETNVTTLKGSQQDPLSWDEVLAERVERCLPYCAKELPRDRVDRLVDACANLEKRADARELLTLLDLK